MHKTTTTSPHHPYQRNEQQLHLTDQVLKVSKEVTNVCNKLTYITQHSQDIFSAINHWVDILTKKQRPIDILWETVKQLNIEAHNTTNPLDQKRKYQEAQQANDEITT